MEQPDEEDRIEDAGVRGEDREEGHFLGNKFYFFIEFWVLREGNKMDYGDGMISESGARVFLRILRSNYESMMREKEN